MIVLRRHQADSLLRPGVAKTDGAIEDGLGAGLVVVAIGDEVAEALELVDLFGCGVGGSGLDVGADGFERIRIDHADEASFGSIGIFCREKAIVEADFSFHAMLGADPVNGGAAFHAFRGVGALGTGEVFAADFGDLAGGILFEAGALHDVAAAEADVAAGSEAEVFLLRDFHEVIGLDPEFAGKRDLTGAHGGVLRVVVELDVLALAGGEVFDDELERIDDAHAARGGGIQMIANLELELRDIGDALELGDAGFLAELADGDGGDAAAACAGERGHARIIPAGDVSFVHQPDQLALAQDGVGEIQFRELDLAWLRRHRAILDHPIVEGTVDLELQGAERVGDVLVRVLQRMREVIHRVEAPGIAGIVMLRLQHAVDHGIPHDDVRRGHVDLRTEDSLAFLEATGPHLGEELEILLHGAITPGRRSSRDGEIAAGFLDLIRSLLVDVGEAILDEMDGAVVVELEVVAGVVEIVTPIEAQPFHVGLDAFDVLDLFLLRIGIVEAQMATRTDGGILLSDPEVQADRTGVAEVQVAIRLRGKARDGGLVLTGGEVGGDDLADEIGLWGIGHLSGKECQVISEKASSVAPFLFFCKPLITDH